MNLTPSIPDIINVYNIPDTNLINLNKSIKKKLLEKHKPNKTHDKKKYIRKISGGELCLIIL